MVVTKTVRRQKPENGPTGDYGADYGGDDEEEEKAAQEGAEEIQAAPDGGQEAARVRVRRDPP